MQRRSQTGKAFLNDASLCMFRVLSCDSVFTCRTGRWTSRSRSPVSRLQRRISVDENPVRCLRRYMAGHAVLVVIGREVFRRILRVEQCPASAIAPAAVAGEAALAVLTTTNQTVLAPAQMPWPGAPSCCGTRHNRTAPLASADSALGAALPSSAPNHSPAFSSATMPASPSRFSRSASRGRAARRMRRRGFRPAGRSS